MKLAQFYSESNLMEEAFLVTEKAFLVYEAFYGKKSLITAKAATKLSEILVSLGRYDLGKELVVKACTVYSNHLQRNEEIKSNLYEKSHILKEFYLACLVGLVLGLKTSEFGLVKLFGDKIWTIICQSENPDFAVVLQIIEYVLKAKLNLIGAKKSAKVQYFVNVKMKVNEDDRTVQAMDILVPKIGEVIGGSVREDRLDKLDEMIAYKNLDKESYWWYRQLRMYGSVPHAGFGLGFERLVMMATGVENIRDVIPFPRWPGHADF
jgi:hypothetical protein